MYRFLFGIHLSTRDIISSIKAGTHCNTDQKKKPFNLKTYFTFLDFALAHCVAKGIGELSQEKLPKRLELKHHSVRDVIAQIGSIAEIRDDFLDFQTQLCEAF